MRRGSGKGMSLWARMGESDGNDIATAFGPFHVCLCCLVMRKGACTFSRFLSFDAL